MGNCLVIYVENVKFLFEFFWVDNDVINVFVFFGGYIGVYIGLMCWVKIESELVFVLVYEIFYVI